MAPRQTNAMLEAFHEWSRIRLRGHTEIREDGEDPASLPGGELYELFRSACEHGYESGFRDGHDSDLDDAASLLLERGRDR